MHLEGTGINPTPVDLHEQQLSLEQHSQAHRITTMDIQQRTRCLILPGPPLLSHSAHADYCTLVIDDSRQISMLFIFLSLMQLRMISQGQEYYIRVSPSLAFSLSEA